MSNQSDLFDPEAQRRHVTVSNDFVTVRVDWTIMMHRIMMVLISQIDSVNDSAFRRQRLLVRDISSMADVTGNSQHEQAREATQRLVREPIEFETEDGSWAGMPIFTDLRYMRHRGLITARFHENARPYLLEQKRRFTTWRLDLAIRLSTPYAVRHYNLAKMIERKGGPVSQKFDEQRFREMFRLEEKYARFRDLSRRVIDPSLEEINDKTDVRVGYDIVRSGRTPVGVKFWVKSQDAEQPTSPRVPVVQEPDVSDYEAWFEELEQSRWKELMQRAESMAKDQGYDPAREHTFQAGVQQMMNRIYREETGKADDQ